MWLGPAGTGSRLKLVLNNWLVCLVESAAETLALADTLGLDERLFVDAVAGGPLESPFAVAKATAMIEDDFAPGFPLRHALKDAWLTMSAARSAGVDLPLTATLARRWRRLVDGGHGDQDVAVAIEGA